MMWRAILMVAMFASQNVRALQCNDQFNSIEERVESASEIFVAVIASAQANLESNPLNLSANYILLESLKGSPKSAGIVTSKQTMNGIIFAPGSTYLLFLHGSSEVAKCTGSTMLALYNAPFRNEEQELLEHIKGLVREDT